MLDPKLVVRKGTLLNRKSLDKHVWEERNNRVCNLAKMLIDDLNIYHFHVFLPIKRNNEVDLWGLLFYAIDNKKQVYISATDFDNESMTHYLYTKDLVLEDDQFGIPTPKNGKPTGLDKLELIFIPMLAGDKTGHRLGYGKGYYDRLLIETANTVIKVGVSLNPLFDKFPFTEPHDVAMNYIITPQEIVKC